MQSNEGQGIWEWYPCSQSVMNYNQITGKPINLIANNKVIIYGQQHNLTLSLNLVKPFNFNNEIGWNWHKSWNMPDIICMIESQDFECQNLIRELKFTASLLVVKSVYESMTLESLGCRGNTSLIMCDGKCTFKSLKFGITSYNSEHSKFQLLLVISQTLDNGESRIVFSRISPGIFVDSRKHARVLSRQGNIQSFIEPFLPETLEKELFKRESRNHQQSIILIQNDIQGLINYYTAPNIRHKIKHPLFLLLKFNKCVQMFVDEKFINIHNLIDDLQCALFQQFIHSEPSIKFISLLFNSDATDIPTHKKVSKNSMKLTEILQQLENDRYSLYINQSRISKNFTEVKNIPELRVHYKDLFSNLVNSRYQLLKSETAQEEPTKVKKLQETIIHAENAVAQVSTKVIDEKLIYSQILDAQNYIKNIQKQQEEQKLTQEQQKINTINNLHYTDLFAMRNQQFYPYYQGGYPY